jgi:diacylglycerol kinase family enzyme
MLSRLILVINPRSSGFKLVKTKILSHLNEADFAQTEIITFEIQPTNPMSNAQEMASGLRDGDTILVAGGDGTAHIATNAAAISGKKDLKIKYTGFGNFNDYANSFSKNSGAEAVRAIKKQAVKSKVKPIELRVNGEFFRYAPLYATVGLTAEMAEIFEGKRLRKALKKVPGRNSRLALSLLAATRFYFKHRANHLLKIANITTDSENSSAQDQKITDLVFMNGPRMARIMRSRANKLDDETFGFTALNAGDFRKNLPFITKGFFSRIPLRRTKNAKIEFTKPTKIAIQIEGEAMILREVKTLEAHIAEFEISVL